MSGLRRALSSAYLRIENVILDIQLPDKDGKAVYSNLIKLRPEIRVII